MKFLLSIFVLTSLVFTTHSQIKDSINVIDGFSFVSYCDIDTNINYYSNVELHWIDSTGGSSNYKFAEGDKTYLEISIKKKCETKDGSSHEIIIIELNSTDTSDIIKLDSKNTTWLIRNTWRYDPFETIFSGTLNFKNHTLEFDLYVDLYRNMLVNGMMIKNVLIVKP